MRYWGILVAKIAVGAAILYGVWQTLHAIYVPPEHLARLRQQPFLHDLPWTSLMFLYNLLFQGIVFLVILDQRYRCRACGRRLRMPVSTAKYAQTLLFGLPQTQYICPFGHGTLSVPDLHITGKEPASWEPHADIWKELHDLEAKKNS